MSTPMIAPVLQHMIGQLLTITKANGYYYDVTADQIVDVRKDLEVDGSSQGPNLSLYVTGWNKLQTGDQANFGQVLAQVHWAVDIAINVQADSTLEMMQAAADVERALKKDYSQGGTCKNTTSPDLSIFGFSLSGWYHASLTGDVLVPWGENDPSSEFSTTYN